MAVVDLEHVTRLAETLSRSEKQRLIAHLSHQIQMDALGETVETAPATKSSGIWPSKFARSGETETTQPPLQTEDGSSRPRIAGLSAGEVWMSDDFNAELPDEFWFGKP